jgi:serine-type D-Ala-D-Ala carboxypeptidase (penicillin-binding protein 5/6)
LPQKQDIFDQLIPKLELKDNHFQIKSKQSLIPQALAGQDFDQATAYGVIDFQTGEVLLQKNLDQKLPIASITKVMSAVVTLDLLDPSEKLTVNYHDTQVEPTKLALKIGEKYTVEELLNAALMSSANDSIEMLKEAVDSKYGTGIFVRSMNAKAEFLGLKNTHFVNPQGLDDGHPYSSVEDQAILANYALNNYPLIKQIVSQDHGELVQSTSHHEEYLNNWNGLLGVYPGVYGIKIGNTDDAKNTTEVVSERGGQKLLVVVLGAGGVLKRDTYAAELLDLGFKQRGLEAVNVTESELRAKYATWKY